MALMRCLSKDVEVFVLTPPGSTLCEFFVVRKTAGMRLTACILRSERSPSSKEGMHCFAVFSNIVHP